MFPASRRLAELVEMCTHFGRGDRPTYKTVPDVLYSRPALRGDYAPTRGDPFPAGKPPDRGPVKSTRVVDSCRAHYAEANLHKGLFTAHKLN